MTLEEFMKGSGRMTFDLELDLRGLKMGTYIKGSFFMARHMEMGNTHGQTGKCLMGSG